MSSKQQTALMMSIQRKREKVDRLYCASATHTSDRMRNIYKGMIRALKSEIAEDERLLAQEKEMIINLKAESIQNADMLFYGDPAVREATEWFEETYQQH